MYILLITRSFDSQDFRRDEALDIWFHHGRNGNGGNDAGEGHQGQLGRHGHASTLTDGNYG